MGNSYEEEPREETGLDMPPHDALDLSLEELGRFSDIAGSLGDLSIGELGIDDLENINDQDKILRNTAAELEHDKGIKGAILDTKRSQVDSAEKTAREKLAELRTIIMAQPEKFLVFRNWSAGVKWIVLVDMSDEDGVRVYLNKSERTEKDGAETYTREFCNFYLGNGQYEFRHSVFLRSTGDKTPSGAVGLSLDGKQVHVTGIPCARPIKKRLGLVSANSKPKKKVEQLAKQEKMYNLLNQSLDQCQHHMSLDSVVSLRKSWKRNK